MVLKQGQFRKTLENFETWCWRRIVVSLTRGSWALFPLVTETLRADSRAVTCCPEDGRLTFGGWVVVVKEW